MMRTSSLAVVSWVVVFALYTGTQGLAAAQEPVQTPLPASQAPPQLVAAIDAYAAANLQGTYLKADCSRAAVPDDGGKWCWSLLQLETSRATVGFAQANSDVGAPAVHFRLQGGVWSPEGVQPPATGTGLAGNDSHNRLAPLLGGIALIIASAGFAMIAVRRR